MLKQRSLTFVSLALLVSVALTACSESGSGQSPSETTAVSDTASESEAPAAGGDYTIALSNSFLGNSWRQTMVKAFEHTAEQAKADGIIGDYVVSNTSQNTATEQISQIKSLILTGPDAIVINSASPTALNPVIEEACAAGIVVVVFDSLASAECEYDVVNGLKEYGYDEAKTVAEAMDGSGSVLMVRGIVGSAAEDLIHSGQVEALQEYPDIEIVQEIVGQASDSVTQEAVLSVLPSLSQIDGVITGGSSYGALQAFQSAGRELPAASFDNSGESLRFWRQLIDDATGFRGGSVRSEPGQASAAFWVAIELLEGNEVPKTVTLPNIVITEDDLDQWIEATPPGNTAAWLWTREQTRDAIEANAAGETVAALPPSTVAP